MKLPETCPLCGRVTVKGYGLTGGGCGLYVMCTDERCDFFEKKQDDEGSVDERSGSAR
jgi:ssDNA-binding Zn-finger/Zn-ribbon topoisomerase 1